MNNNSCRLTIKFSFTLIEAIIVAVLFSVVGLSVLGTFMSGIKVWQKVYQKDSDEDIAIFFDEFSFNLKNTILYNSVPFKGNKTKLSFATFIRTNSKFDGLKEGVGEVIYYWNKKERKIFRIVKNLSDIYRRKEESRMILGDVDNFKLSYYFYDSKEKKYFWSDEWGQKRIPMSVSIYISICCNNKKFVYRRIVNIPIGQI